MKVCISCVKTFKKANELQVTERFVSEMVNAGMPEQMSDELIDKGRAVWTESKVDCDVIYAAEIIDSDSET